MIVISNASPLIALGRIYRVDIFQKLFGRIVIPDIVFQEVVVNCPDSEQKKYLEDCLLSFIDVKQPREHQIFTRNLGAGEQGVLSLAVEISPDIVLLDDKKARNEALELGYMPAFTTNVIKEAEFRGIIPSYQEIFRELYRHEIYLPEH